MCLSDLSSSTGDALFNVTAMWVVYTLSGSVLATALIQVLWHLPAVLFGLHAGLLPRRYSPKRLLVSANYAAALIVGSLGTVTLVTGALHVVPVLAVVVLLNTAVVIMSPARYTLIPRLVAKRDLATVNGVLSSIQTGALLIGSALAGVMLATVGRAWGLLADALSFLISGSLMLRIGDPTPRRDVPGTIATGPPQDTSGTRIDKAKEDGVLAGLRWAFRDRFVGTFVLLMVFLNAASFVGPLYPALLKEHLHAGPGAYGFVEAAGISGVMVGGAISGPLARLAGAGRLLLAGLFVAALATGAIGLSRSVGLTAAANALLSLSMAIGAVGVGAKVQASVPDDMRARLGGILKVSGAVAIPGTTLLAGWGADIAGPSLLFVAAGLYLLGITIFAWTSRPVRESRLPG